MTTLASMSAPARGMTDQLLTETVAPFTRITQDLGAGSASCRMDAGALEDAVGPACARPEAEGADIVVLNKFVLSEAQGRGFSALIAEALSRAVPVLTGLSDTHLAAFEDFAEGMARPLEPDETAILDWCRSVINLEESQAEEV